MSKRIRVARVGELREDQTKLVLIHGREVALFRRKGRYFALDNRCPHQGGSLGEGFFEGERILCPWHHWDFHLETGRSRLGEDVCVKPYRVEVEEEEIYILDPRSPG